MTITHVIPYMHPNAGGPPVVVDRLCQKLVGRGWDVRVITTDALSEVSDNSWAKRYEDRYPLEIHRTSKPRSFAYSSSLAAAIKSAVRQSSLVHLHTLWTYPTFAAARICRKLDVPFVIMPHGMLDPHSLARKRLKKWLYGWLFEWPNVRAARAMIYTHTEEGRLAESAVSRLPKGYIVPLGADHPPAEGRPTLAEEFYQKHPGLRGRSLITFLGRLHPKKGLDLLIPGFAEVARADPNARLMLAGPGEAAYLQGLNELAAHHGLTEKIKFLGPLEADAKWQTLAASTVFVLPSYQENFALTVVEAMRSGVPVVLSRRVNIWQDVTEAGAGLACELSATSVAKTILAVLGDPNLRTMCGCRGQQLAAERFNWERSVQALENVYRQLLTEKSAPTHAE